MYREEWLYFKRDYRKPFWWVLFIAIVFFLVLLWGAELLFRSDPDTVMQYLQQKLSVDSPHMTGSGFTYILWHNLQAAIRSLVLGLIPLIVLPAVTTIATLASISFVVPFAHSLGISAWKVLVFGILPHGVFEIPAFALAGAIGIFMSLNIFRQLFAVRKPNRSILQIMMQCLRSFIFVVIPLLLIAAAIEAYVTSALLAHFS